MKRVVLFQVGEQSYGLDLMYSRGIENYSNIMMVPDAPENIQGIVNIRKELIPVYNLRKKFHLSEAVITPETKLILGKMQGMLIAYVVDKVMEILELPEEAFTPSPLILKGEGTGYVGSFIQSKVGLSILIDQEGILTKEEKEQIEKILSEMKKKEQEEEERRIEEERRRKEEERKRREEEEEKF